MEGVEIPLKISGIAEIKAELRDLKSQMLNATDPTEMAALAEQAGRLKDQLKDTNEAAEIFASGSKFEQVSNSFGAMKNDLMSLDFEGASEKAKIFSSALGSINPATITGSIKGMISTVGTLGGAFVKLGATILANPMFLLVAVIVAIVAAVAAFADKFGFLDDIMSAIMVPINAVIDAFYAVTDALGLTTHALDEEAEAQKANTDAVMKAADAQMNYATEKKDHEIEMARIAKKDTTKLELEKVDIATAAAAKKRAEIAKELAMSKHMTDEDSLKRRAELFKTYDEQNAIIRKAVNQRIEIKARAAAAAAEAERKAEEAAAAAAEKQQQEAEAAAERARAAAAAAAQRRREKAKQDAANRLKAGRELRDFELSQIEDAAKREEAIIREKYARLLTDLQKDESKNADEKIKYQKMYETQLTQELNKQGDVTKKAREDAEIKANEAILQLKLQLMPEGEAKEKAMQDDKYKKLRDAVLADEKLTQEKKDELIALYDQQRNIEDQKKIDDKKKEHEKEQSTLLATFATQKDKELEALRLKYEEQRKIAADNSELQLLIDKKYADDKKKIDDDAALAAIEAKKKERDAIITAASEISTGLVNLGTALIKDQKKLEKFNKASALIQIGIDTAKAISSLVAQSQANPMNAITGGAAGIAQFASGMLQILTNIAKAKQILSSPSSNPSMSSGGGGGGSSSSSTAQVLPQAAQLFGQGNTGNVMSAGGTSNESSMTVTAVVSETAMTSTQNKIQRIKKNAEL